MQSNLHSEVNSYWSIHFEFFSFKGKLPSSSTTPKSSSFVQPSQESTTGNQILLSTDDTAVSRAPPSLVVLASPVLPTQSKASTFVQDDAHV